MAGTRRARNSAVPDGASSRRCRRTASRDLAVLRAFDADAAALVRAHRRYAHRAYEDSALPIGNGQTISQPSVHARYLELLRLTRQRARARDRDGLRIPDRAAVAPGGAGVLDRARRALYDKARDLLRQLDVRNVSMLLGDGTIGWREYAPYDAILVSAGAPDVPRRCWINWPKEGRSSFRSAAKTSSYWSASSGVTERSRGVTSRPSDSSRSWARTAGKYDLTLPNAHSASPGTESGAARWPSRKPRIPSPLWRAVARVRSSDRPAVRRPRVRSSDPLVPPRPRVRRFGQARPEPDPGPRRSRRRSHPSEPR